MAEQAKWQRTEEGAYVKGGAAIYDNGGGLGSAKGGGRWALELDGVWLANIDYLADAKARAERELAYGES